MSKELVLTAWRWLRLINNNNIMSPCLLYTILQINIFLLFSIIRLTKKKKFRHVHLQSCRHTTAI